MNHPGPVRTRPNVGELEGRGVSAGTLEVLGLQAQPAALFEDVVYQMLHRVLLVRRGDVALELRVHAPGVADPETREEHPPQERTLLALVAEGGELAYGGFVSECHKSP